VLKNEDIEKETIIGIKKNKQQTKRTTSGCMFLLGLVRFIERKGEISNDIFERRCSNSIERDSDAR
jgi:hypothetical protein